MAIKLHQSFNPLSLLITYLWFVILKPLPKKWPLISLTGVCSNIWTGRIVIWVWECEYTSSCCIQVLLLMCTTKVYYDDNRDDHYHKHAEHHRYCEHMWWELMCCVPIWVFVIQIFIGLIRSSIWWCCLDIWLFAIFRIILLSWILIRNNYAWFCQKK